MVGMTQFHKLQDIVLPEKQQDCPRSDPNAFQEYDFLMATMHPKQKSQNERLERNVLRRDQEYRMSWSHRPLSIALASRKAFCVDFDRTVSLNNKPVALREVHTRRNRLFGRNEKNKAILNLMQR